MEEEEVEEEERDQTPMTVPIMLEHVEQMMDDKRIKNCTYRGFAKKVNR